MVHSYGSDQVIAILKAGANGKCCKQHAHLVCVLESLEVEAKNNGQFVEGQLLGRLLVAMATTALDFRCAAEMFRSRESAKVKLRQACGWIEPRESPANSDQGRPTFRVTEDFSINSASKSIR